MTLLVTTRQPALENVNNTAKICSASLNGRNTL